jgi:UDP-N-acetylglucosamine--N-acetylmuramyl-(pentapeptide) pyrophosphoryl-undecaprenol N-acetylglucosamine transferase
MKLLVAGGGTGGHLYPGIAVAEQVVRRGGEVMFVGTSRGLEARVVPAAGYALELLEVSGLKRVGAAAFARGLARIPAALARSMAILRRFRPDAVLGVGGYASGPMVLAAALGRVPTAIQEQNSVPGVTNRALGRVVKKVFTAFEDAAAFFPAHKIERLGNPVRAKFVDAAAGASPAVGTRLLVVGGSQGARAVNDLALAAAERLAADGALPSMVHQTGAADLERCTERYRALGLDGRVTVAPFIDDMAVALREAALVIGRAGALTLAELAVVGRPAILIPLPTATDDHQRRNAESFARAGAALVMDQADTDGAALSAAVRALLGDARRLQEMAAAMAALGRPDAARDVADRLQALAHR